MRIHFRIEEPDVTEPVALMERPAAVACGLAYARAKRRFAA